MRVPIHTQKGINNYVCSGVPTGSFLRAVFSNNLFEAFCRADSDNTENMLGIVTFIHNYVPHCCYGDEDTIREWLRLHREEPEKIHQAINRYQQQLEQLTA